MHNTTNKRRQRPSSWICSFHITWIAFCVCFFAWFCTTNIYSAFVMDTHFKPPLSIIDHQIAGGLSVTSTILFRLIVGYFIGRNWIGPRACYVVVLLLTAVVLIGFALFVHGRAGYYLAHFLLGICGSSFVITQYYTTQMVSSRVAGLAQAITAGFGNFGGGIANAVMPLLLNSSDLSWRVYMYLLAVLLVLIAILFYVGTKDMNAVSKTHTHDIDLTSVNNPMLLNDAVQTETAKTVYTVCNRRVWLLFVCYAACFGVELTFYLQASYWFHQQFGFNDVICGALVMLWSSANIFGRPLGGCWADRYGIRQRVYLLFVALLMEGIFIILFGVCLMYNNSAYSVVLTLCVMMVFSLMVQMAEGIVFSIVPFVKLSGEHSTGHVMGVVGSGGNLGATLFVFGLFIPLNELKGNPWILLGCVIILCSFSSLFIRFQAKDVERDTQGRDAADMDLDI